MSSNELIEVFAICIGDNIEIERNKVKIERGFLLDLEAHYTCPGCGEYHVATIENAQSGEYTLDSTYIDRGELD
jgi:hypothetical protein